MHIPVALLFHGPGMRSRVCSWQKQHFPAGAGMMFKMSMHMHGRKLVECPNSAPSACTDRKKAWRQGTSFRSLVSLSDTWVISQQNREEIYRVYKIAPHSRLPRLKLELPPYIVPEEFGNPSKYANHLGGYWFNLEIGSSFALTWLDLPCSWRSKSTDLYKKHTLYLFTFIP